MDTKELRAALERISGIRHPCDLDLLLFFYRHPCALLTSERIVEYVGYDRDRVSKSLDGLIDAGLLSRSPNPAHAARLYLLKLQGRPGGPLEPLLHFAATRPGRREVMQLLEPAPRGAPTAGNRPSASITKIA